MILADIIGEELDDKYRVVRRLGGGAFGDVYLAKDDLAGRHVAIKRLKDTDPERRSDLVHEMRSLDQLHHPNIVGFYHHFYQNDALFLVMEYCAGGSLSRRIANDPAPVHTIMGWGKELADALGQVHQRGIVHHDLKPDNILFGEDGTVKIGDFGAANRNIGTAPYVSPEMVRGEADLGDVRVDIYALGMTLLEALLTRMPFSGLTRLEMQQAKVRHDFIPSDMERWVQEILSRATHPTPELRFQSMEEFSEAIAAKHVNYVFRRERVQAHRLAADAERHLARGRVSAATKCVRQALFAGPDCVSAIVADGRCKLFVNRIAEAKSCFDQALQLNPRVNIHRELGWLNLETGNYSRAISLLTDHLQRSGGDYEAYNLLLECFYRTERFEAGIELAKLMIAEKAPSTCFAGNGLICRVRADPACKEIVRGELAKLNAPFAACNAEALRGTPSRAASLLLFENHRFGLPARKANILTIEVRGLTREFKETVITVGRDEENQLGLNDNFVSRRHCVFLNYFGDVWIYDLGSKFGVTVDGSLIARKAYLDGVHTVSIGDSELKVSSKAGLLV